MNVTAKIVTALIALAVGVNVYAIIVGAQNNPVSFDNENYGENNLVRAHRSVIDTNISSLSDPPTGEVYNVTYFNHADTNFPIINSTIRMQLQYHMSWQQSVGQQGVYEIQVFHNGNAIEECDFEAETFNPGTLGGSPRTDLSIQVICLIPDPPFGDNRITITRTITSGTPAAIQQEIISHGLERQDLIIVDTQTTFEASIGATGLEFIAWLAILAFAGILATSGKGRVTSGLISAMFSFLAIIVALFVFAPPFTVLGVLAGLAALAFSLKATFGSKGADT